MLIYILKKNTLKTVFKVFLKKCKSACLTIHKYNKIYGSTLENAVEFIKKEENIPLNIKEKRKDN